MRRRPPLVAALLLVAAPLSAQTVPVRLTGPAAGETFEELVYLADLEGRMCGALGTAAIRSRWKVESTLSIVKRRYIGHYQLELTALWGGAPGSRRIAVSNGACPAGAIDVEITAPPPPDPDLTAAFTFSPAEPIPGQEVVFDATDSEGAPDAYVWDFGDGTAALGATVTKAYPEGGIFHVHLRTVKGESVADTADQVDVGYCRNGEHELCLQEQRFAVSMSWRANGTQGYGIPVRLTSDSAYFWFFDGANVEVLVKVLDACTPPFEHFWVFLAGLTDVAVEVLVVDRKTGLEQRYANPGGTLFAPKADTGFFETCP